MPSKQQAINSFKSLAQELNMSIGNNSVDTNTVKKNQNKSKFIFFIIIFKEYLLFICFRICSILNRILYAVSGYAKIYIGNIAVKASRVSLHFSNLSVIEYFLYNDISDETYITENILIKNKSL